MSGDMLHDLILGFEHGELFGRIRDLEHKTLARSATDQKILVSFTRKYFHLPHPIHNSSFASRLACSMETQAKN